VEKPAPDEAPSDLAAAARYVVYPSVFDILRRTPPGKGGEIQLTDALQQEVAHGGVAVPLAPGEIRHDIGGLDSYYKAFAAFALADEEHGTELRRYLSERLQNN
jgi:UTP--glucose-1-phosphate uridylyltransferase